MPAVAGDTASGASALIGQRWQAIDPLLPPPGAGGSHCGAQLAVAAPGRLATGSCEHWAGAPGSMDLTWGAARRFQLTAQVAGPDVSGALDALLTQWRDHLADVPEAGGEDTAAVVNWPSRDIDGVKPLLRHGLVPLAVIAARAAGGLPGAQAARQQQSGSAPDASPDPQAAGGLRIRLAESADLDAVVRLGLEVIRFDAHFGTVIERPFTADALRGEAAGLLAGPDGWTWLAERDGEPIGVLYAEQPRAAAWIAPMAGPAPAAYLELMGVAPGERGQGVGAALVSRFHREADAAGVAVTLLHYERVNPLSAPFWSQQGYRPLWSTWEARPAHHLR
ncbi:MAG: GNAT family N-acetyltransferase [Streptosporangiaceae bacterium]